MRTLIACLCGFALNSAATAQVKQSPVLSSGLGAFSSPSVSPLGPNRAAALSLSLSPLSPLSPLAPTAAPVVSERRGGLLSPEHAPVLFSPIPETSRLDPAAARDALGSDFIGRLDGTLAAPEEAATEPELRKAAVLSLHTTQMAAGMKEVEHKTEKIQALVKDPQELSHYLKANPVPVVLGPGGKMYIIDHHHLVRAAWEAGVSEVYIEVKADLSDEPSEAAFWKRMEKEAWVYPYDENGKRCSISELPKDVRGLVDDPYRSVAWAVRERGGFEKTGKPFAEFKWADFFREHLKIHPKHHGFHEAVEEAMELAKSPEARHLPGYVGGK